jgi:hypothetical protein
MRWSFDSERWRIQPIIAWTTSHQSLTIVVCVLRAVFLWAGESTWNDTFNRSKIPHKFAWRLAYSAVYEIMLIVTGSKVQPLAHTPFSTVSTTMHHAKHARSSLALHRTAPHRTAPHRTAPHRTALHRTAPAPHRTAPHRIAPHPTAPHPTAPHHTPPHRTAPHRTAPHRTRTAPHKLTCNRYVAPVQESWFLDSPLSEHGLDQAEDLQKFLRETGDPPPHTHTHTHTHTQHTHTHTTHTHTHTQLETAQLCARALSLFHSMLSIHIAG